MHIICRHYGHFGFRVLAWLVALASAVAVAGPAHAPETNTWWSLRPLTRPAVPVSAAAANPIDAFIRQKLHAEGVSPAPEADRRILIRRVSFDLTGLPPTPEDVEAFESDDRAGAYDCLVDRLLAQPSYGERWARHWMDAVHFAETHGHDQDRIRTNAWPYRDHLVAALNFDKPYTRFVSEQVAGDVLYPDDPGATVALGLLATGPWDESSLRDIREDTLDRQRGRYLDRDDMVTTVMQTFTSTTVQCARCHDHKFDPISQSDYYALQAVLAGTDRGDRRYDADPELHQHRQRLRKELRQVQRREPSVLARLRTEVEPGERSNWERELAAHEPQWETLVPTVFTAMEGTQLVPQADHSLLATGPLPARDTYSVMAEAEIAGVTAVRLEVLPDDSLPMRGPGRQANGNFHLSEFELRIAPVGGGEFQNIPLQQPSADFNQDGWGIARAVDGDEKTAWGIHPRVGLAHQAAFEISTKSPLTGRFALWFVLKQRHGEGHEIGRFRLAITRSQRPIRLDLYPEKIATILAIPELKRGVDQRDDLNAYWLQSRLEKQLAALPPPSLVYAGASDFMPNASHQPTLEPRLIHVLHRGEITQQGIEATPGTLGCVQTLPSRFVLDNPNDEGERRAALAKWLIHTDNPLTWRSIVNRVWHLHFGRGMVDTPNDFGRMGGMPSHPELLDWLALWFRDDAQGSLKALHRLIVTSETYRQSARWTDPAMAVRGAAIDADNRWLGRMNRTRLDAEELRDALLQIADRLDFRMGGPSDQQFDLQPGIHVTPKVDYTKFNVESMLGRRRGVYRFLFRTLPDPFMDSLDCPAGDQLTPVRNSGVTVQHALVLWNNAFSARMSAHFAERLQREARTIDTQVASAFRDVLLRAPTSTEKRDFGEYARLHGLSNLARLLFNSNEFVFVE